MLPLFLMRRLWVKRKMQGGGHEKFIRGKNLLTAAIASKSLKISAAPVDNLFLQPIAKLVKNCTGLTNLLAKLSASERAASKLGYPYRFPTGGEDFKGYL